MIIFNREPLATTDAGKVIAKQQKQTRKEMVREKLENDPNMIRRGYKHGWIKFGERVLFVRSQWDANMCAYYENLKNTGIIQNWFYEPITFWFKGVQRGTNNYKPDFKIEQDALIEYYVEVKGHWVQKDEVKKKRMKKYHPAVRMEYVLPEDYKRIEKQYNWVPGWNQPFLKREEVQHMIPIKLKTIRKKALK